MKPIKISIAGFNSFRENVTIDFEELSSRGIFGIFGKTGSGKSTILDAVTFALYGVISRYGSKYGNCVNENETEAKVELEFVLNDTSEHRYLVRRSIKKKVNGDYSSPYAVLIDISKGNVPIAEKTLDVNQKIEDLLGLNYDEFVKTVVLPQGSFKDFLLMEGGERRKILERIFGLGKYGEKLQKSASEKKYIQERKKAEIEGQIALLNDVSEETLQSDEESLKLENAELRKLLEQNLKISEEAKKAVDILEIRKKLADFEEERKALEKNAAKIEDLKQRQAKSEKAERIMPIIDSYESLQKKVKIALEECAKFNEKMQEAEKAFENWNEKYEIAKRRYDEKYVKGIEKKGKLENAVLDFKEYEKNQKNVEECDEKLKKMTAACEKRSRELRLKLSEKEKYAKLIVELDERLMIARKMISHEAEYRTIFNSYKIIEKLNFEIQKLNEEIRLNKDEIEKNRRTESEISSKLNELKADERSYYIEKVKRELQNGDICPICNSQICHEIQIETEKNFKFADFENTIKNLEFKHSEVKEKIARSEAVIQRAQESVFEKNIELSDVQAGSGYDDSGLNSHELESKLLEIEAKKNEAKKIEDELQSVKAEIDKCDEVIAGIKEEIIATEKNQSVLKAQLDLQAESQDALRAAVLETLGEFANPIIEKERLETALVKLETDLRIAGEQKNEAFILKNTLQLEYSAVNSEYKTLKSEFDKTIANLQNQFNQHYGFTLLQFNESSDIEAFENMLAQVKKEHLNIEEYEKNRIIIEKYLQDFNGIESKIFELKRQSGKDERTKQALEDLIRKSESMSELLDEHKKKIGIIEKNIEIATEKLKLKSEKRELLVALENKIGLLEELLSLFSARKFAEYMAIEQLRYITKGASEILSKITSGKYNLIVGDDGIFKIQDFKNGGIIRGIKSMSGGETFVVSLALALALSTQLQLKGRAPIELFFLDEGFGTLDDELLDTVMDSLERLASPRFKIGIVSHVEQLKQRMPVKLIVIPAEVGGAGTKVRIE